MDDPGKENFQEAQKKIRKGRDRLKRAGTLLKELEKYYSDPEKNAFVIKEKLSALESSSGELQELGDIHSIISQLSADLSSSAEEVLHRAKTVVASCLAKELEKKDLELTGNFPQLHCGLLTLDFSFESGGKVTIYFGPRIEKLKQTPIAIERIADAVFTIYESLEGKSFDERKHLELIFMAYQNALKLLGGEPGSAVPISEVLFHTAILKQGKKFHTDPIKTSFTSYGRVRFAYELARTKIREIGGYELHMTVSSMEQTRKPESHLWVPRGLRDHRGTHFSSMTFRKIGI
jgi:hypothetical protein